MGGADFVIAYIPRLGELTLKTSEGPHPQLNTPFCDRKTATSQTTHPT